MRRTILGTLLLASAFLAGCGSSSGIQPGIPADATSAPVNPTDDMGPAPKPAAKAK